MRSGQASSGLFATWQMSLGLISGVPLLVFSYPMGDGWMPPSLEGGGLIAVHAAAATLLGAGVAQAVLSRRAPVRPPWPARLEEARYRLLAIIGLAILVFLRFIPRLPTLHAVITTAVWLIPLGLGVLIRAKLEKQSGSVLMWAGVLLFMPLATTTLFGFMGYGASLVLLGLGIVAGTSRRRGLWSLATPLVFYAGLSLFVTYLGGRGEIRSAIDRGESLEDRFRRVGRLVTELEWFDPGNAEHRIKVDDRLNQVSFVGLAVENLGSGFVDFGRGESLTDALISLVPRFVWRDKPVVAGSGSIVSRYTLLQFGENTSVGATQLFEAYVNFGMAGVWAIFSGLGCLMAVVDSRSGQALERDDAGGFLQWALPACAVLNVGGSFVETTASAAAGFLLARGLKELGWGARGVDEKSATGGPAGP